MPLVLLALMAVSAPAQAHPFDASFHGHQLEVELDGPALRVAYAVEVPTLAALADLERFLEGVDAPGPEHQAAYTERVLDELESGLIVAVDGERAALERLQPAAVSGVGDRRFITFRLLGEVPLPPDAETIHVVNANFPGEPGLFSTVVRVDDAIRVHDTDLVRWSNGRVVADDGGRWLGGEARREVRVAFARARPLRAWLRRRTREWVEPDGPRLRTAREALVRDAPGLVRRVCASGATTGGVAAAALAAAVELGPGALSVGLAAGALGVRRRALLVATAFCGLALVAGAWTGPAAAAALAGSLLGVSGLAAAGRRPGLAGALALGAAALPGSTALGIWAELGLVGAGVGAVLLVTAVAAGLLPTVIGRALGAAVAFRRPGPWTARVAWAVGAVGGVLVVLGRVLSAA